MSDRRLLLGLVTGLVALTWLSLWVWGRSPNGRFLSHEELETTGGVGGEYFWIVLLFVAGWTLMTIAMMLPTSLPLVALFHSFVRGRPNRARLVALLVGGYLGVWTVFGLAAHAGDRMVHEVVERSARLEASSWVIATSTILLAGVYQFAPLKHRCLDKCRSPLAFVMEHWRGGNAEAEALRLGIRHGLFCLGCCWSLMLLMFAVGIGNVAWMLALGIVMAVEKNVSWGRRLSTPVGVLLVGWGLILAAAHASNPGGI